MTDELEEIPSDWINYKIHKPAKSGYYEATCCPDPENVIKWEVVAYSDEDDEFYSLPTLHKPGNPIKAVKFWIKHKPKCT